MSPSQKDDDGQEWEDISLPDTKSLHWACRYCRTWNSPERETCVECRRWAERWMGGKRIFDPDVLLPRSELEALISQALADHRDAQQLREEAEQERHYKRQANQQSASLAVEKIALEERVRVLEEALREIESVDIANLPTNPDQAVRLFVDALAKTRHIARALLSPAAATEGGEGA